MPTPPPKWTRVTRDAARLIERAPHTELVMEPELSVVTFRRTGWSASQYRAWSDAELASGTSFVVPTTWNGEVVLRLCIVNPVTSIGDIALIVDSRRRGNRADLEGDADAWRHHGGRPGDRRRPLRITDDGRLARREIDGGWLALSGGLITGIGEGEPPAAADRLGATDCLVTPGLINAHHHLFQNLARAYPAMTAEPLFGWLRSLYPLWRSLDTESAYVSAWVGLAELALSGCTTSSDHLPAPRGAGMIS